MTSVSELIRAAGLSPTGAVYIGVAYANPTRANIEAVETRFRIEGIQPNQYVMNFLWDRYRQTVIVPTIGDYYGSAVSVWDQYSGWILGGVIVLLLLRRRR